jgi:hypothetical protein
MLATYTRYLLRRSRNAQSSVHSAQSYLLLHSAQLAQCAVLSTDAQYTVAMSP